MIAIRDLEPLAYKPDGFESTTDETLYFSIGSIGLQDPLVVAIPPNSSKYTLIAGGNSRLQALQRLWVETEDKRFSRASCLVAAWPGEFRACLAHIITNDVRTIGSFLDRARSLTHIVETHGPATKGRNVSQRDAVALLNGNGYPISQACYGYMVYMVKRLAPHLAGELLEQMGLADVRQIREHVNRLKDQVCNQGMSYQEFAALVDLAFASIDLSVWQLSDFCAQIDEIVSNQIGTSVGKQSDSAQIERTEVASEFPQTGNVAETDFPKVELEYSPTGHQEERERLDTKEGNSNVGLVPTSEMPISVGAFELTSSKVRHLRNSSYELAVKLCQGLSIDDACVRKSTTGCGFKMDVGPLKEFEPLQRETLDYLEAFSATTETSDRVVTDVELSSDSTSPDAVRRRVPTTEPTSANYSSLVNAGLWVELEDHEWYTLMELWDVVRLLQVNQVSRVT